MFGLPGWLTIAAVVVVAAITAVLFVFARPTGRTDDRDASAVVRVTFWVAVIWAGISVIGGVVVTLSILIQSDVTITVPVVPFWPELPKGTELDMGTADMVGGGFTSADLVVTGLSTGARVLWAVSQALWWMLPAAIAALIAVACRQLLAGRPFAPVVARAASVTAVAVALGGVAASVLGDIAGSMAAYETLTFHSGSYREVAGIEDAFAAWVPSPTLSVTLPFWPIAAGLAFAALAAIFRYGAKLQRETELLV